MTNAKPFSAEVRELTIRLVLDQERQHISQGACMEAIAPKAARTSQTLRTRVKQAEVDQGRVNGVTSSDHDRLKALERENREWKRAIEILRKASAYLITYLPQPP